MLAYVNHGLDQRDYERRVHGEPTTGVFWNAYALRKAWNQEVKSWAAPWWRENSKEAYASGITALADALKNYSDSKKGTRRGRRVRFPKMKKRHARRSFTVTTGSFGVCDARHVRLPVVGVVRTKEKTTKLLFRLDAGTARVLAATVSETAGRWFVSLRVAQVDTAAPPANPKVVAGADLGINVLTTVVTVDQETGNETTETVSNPKALSRYERRLRRADRMVSRQQRGSRRHRRAQLHRARLHAKVVTIRRDAIHKLTTTLARTYGTVVVEDLGVAGMVKNHHLAKSVSDASFGEIRRQLTYKTTWRSGRLVVADRFYPSSKTCSGCGWRKPSLPLSERRYTCGQCGHLSVREAQASLAPRRSVREAQASLAPRRMDRDINAARNLARLGLATPLPREGERSASFAVAARVNARGELSSGRDLVPVKLGSGKREAGTVAGCPGGTSPYKTSTATTQLVAA